MGNSEVGHLNLGAGRIVYQELTRINKAIADGTLATNPALVKFLADLKGAKRRASSLGPAFRRRRPFAPGASLRAGASRRRTRASRKIFIHAFLDGRDTSPTGGAHYLAELQAKLKEIGAGKIATVIGRYYAMDRDNRWERVELAWKLIFLGEGTYTDDRGRRGEGRIRREENRRVHARVRLREGAAPAHRRGRRHSLLQLPRRPRAATQPGRAPRRFQGLPRAPIIRRSATCR